MSTLKTNEELVAEIQSGINMEENKVQLFRQNKGLIVKYAQNYMNDRTDEEELQDYVSEGYFAVEKACTYYEPKKGASFSTILGYCMQYYFAKYTRNGRLVGIPRGVRENGIKYSKTRAGLLMEKGEAVDAEIMERLGLTESNIETVRTAYTLSVISSLDEPILQSDGSTTNLAEIVADDFDLEKTSVQEITDEQISKILWECINETLTEKRIEVLKMHFRDGLGISQIAKVKGLSRQAVSSMLISSMKKLKKSNELKKLYDSL